MAAKGQMTKMDEDIDAFVRIVSDGHLRAMGIPLRAGRDFTARDSLAGERVVLVNETLARRLWPGRDPIGREITQDGGRRVVGVVGDVRHQALELSAGGEMYLPMRQTDDYDEVDLVVRTALAPAAARRRRCASELMPIAPDLPKASFRTLQQLVDKAVSPRRFVVLLIGGFSRVRTDPGRAGDLRRHLLRGRPTHPGAGDSRRAGRHAPRSARSHPSRNPWPCGCWNALRGHRRGGPRPSLARSPVRSHRRRPGDILRHPRAPRGGRRPGRLPPRAPRFRIDPMTALR